jgi:hypothetical protein
MFNYTINICGCATLGVVTIIGFSVVSNDADSMPKLEGKPVSRLASIYPAGRGSTVIEETSIRWTMSPAVLNSMQHGGTKELDLRSRDCTASIR